VAVRLLGLRVQIPPEAWLCFCCECYVLSGTDICDGSIPRPEESCQMFVSERDIRGPRPNGASEP
jgi:hypothetical protein